MTRDAMLNPPPGTPVFVSTVRMLVEERLGASIPIADLVRQIRGWVKANDIRRDELEWSGLEDWLKPIQELLPNSRVGKSDILEFLDTFELPISDVWYGTDWGMLAPRSNAEARIAAVREELLRLLEQHGVDDAGVQDSMIGALLDAAAGGGASPFPDLGETAWRLAQQLSERQRFLEAVSKGKRDGFEKFSDHVLPGGSYYRELLLTLPASNRVSGLALEALKARAEIEVLRNWIADPENASDPAMADQESALITKVHQLAVHEAESNRRLTDNFRSPKHWDEANVIGHVRFTERIIPFNAIAKLPVYNLPAYAGTVAALSAGTAFDAIPEWAAVLPEVVDELKGYAASDVLAVFAGDVQARAHSGDGEAALIELPLHARVLSTGQLSDGTTAYFVFRGSVPERRVLFVEEIQSDWAQEGRRVGFRQVLTPAEQEEMRVLESLGTDLGSRFNRYQALAAKLAGPIPYGPFVTETTSWVSLCMKRVIRHAAERGYDAVAWTTGEQQMERFYATGGEIIRRLRCKRVNAGRFEIDMDVSKPGGEKVRRRHFEDSTLGLEKRFGGILARAIMERADAAKAQPNGTVGTALARGGAMLRMSAVGRMLPESRPVKDADGYVDVPAAAGMKIGNLGLAAFYDKIVPNIVKDLVKKLGGNGLETFSIPLKGGKTADQLGFAMTDAMRDRALAGMPRYHRAWHGSPHDFDKFTTTRVGSGEGAQAYGWGLYFASRKEVAEYYRKALSEGQVMLNGKPADGATPDGMAARLIAYGMADGLPFAGAKAKVQEEYTRYRDASLRDVAGLRRRVGEPPTPGWGSLVITEEDVADEERRAKYYDDHLKALVEIREGDVTVEKGRLYQVDIPEGDQYLLWDKLLSEQPEKVREIISASPSTTLDEVLRGKSVAELLAWVNAVDRNNSFDELIVDEPDTSADELRSIIRNSYGDEDMAGYLGSSAFGDNRTGESIYRELAAKHGSDKAASDYLHSLGIAGIKYLDGRSRGAKEGDYNYVLFDDAAITVTAKYSRAMRGDEAAFADVTPKRLAKEIGFYGYPGGRSRGFITRLPVADFLELTTSDDGVVEGIKQQAGAFDPARFDSTESFLPYLDIDPETGEVTGHEGRHRAAALLASGAVDMPVVISLRTPVAALDVQMLKGQCGRGAAVLGRAIPLVEGNEALVMEFINAGQADTVARPGPIFYSALAEAVDAIPQNSGSVQQWKGIVANLSGKGIKQAEIEWTGILDWLDLQDGKVSKAAIMEYLRDNGVRVEEVLLGTDRKVQKVPTGWAVIEPDGEVYSIYGGMGEALAVAEHGTLPPQYSKYVLPGGERYRELLLTLPDRDNRREAALRAVDEAETRYSASRSIEDYSALVKARDVVNASGGLKKEFRSQHFQGYANILAHVRFDERVDAEGHRILLIEEIQSDWAQDGKKRGFSGSGQKGEAVSHRNEGAEESYGVHWADGDVEWGYRDMAAAQRAAEEGRGMRDAVPSAPFVADTKAWIGLVLKRMIRFAAESGFEAVAWTTGEQQVERYDLSKQVRSVAWNGRHNDAEKSVTIDPISGNGIEFVVQPNGIVGGRSGGGSGLAFDGKHITDVVGKELGERLLSEPYGDVRGNGLKVGGDGMQVFYDRIVPQVANELLKKLGGNRVASVRIAKADEYGPWVGSENGRMVHAFDTGASARQWKDNGVGRSIDPAQGFIEQPAFAVTAVMRDQALSGLPLFMRSGSADEFPGMTVGRLREEIDNAFGYRFTQNLIDSGAFRLLQRERDLPRHLQHPRGGIGGVYDDLTDKTYLVAQWIRPDMVKGLILHEVGVHYGLNKLLGDRAQVLFNQARGLVRQGDPVAVAASRKVPPDTNPALVNEEILAYMVGDLAGQKLGLVQQTISKIKGFLFELGADIDLTPADMAVMAEGCVKRCASKARRPVVSFFADVARTLKRAVALETNPLPAHLHGEARHAFVGQGAQSADRSLLAEAFALSARLTEAEVKRFHDLEDRYSTLSEAESAEYEALSLRVDVQFDPDIVRQKTGWFMGYDGKWRFEIDDSGARLLKTGDGTRSLERCRLDEILHHPALFEAYPQLRGMNVFFDPSLSFLSSTRGYFDTEKFEIGLSTWVSDDQVFSSLMHEIQHAIQGIEGFARGGSLADFSLKSNAMELFEAAQEVIVETRRLRPDIVSAWETARGYLLSMAEKYDVPQYDNECRPIQRAPMELRKRMSGEERAEYSRLAGVYGELLDGSDEARRFADALVTQHYALMDQDGFGGVKHITARWQYERLAGEIEARDVQARLNLPMDSTVATSEQFSNGAAGTRPAGLASAGEALDAAERWMHHQPPDTGESAMRPGDSRRSVLPYRSQGIPAEEVIVRFGRVNACDAAGVVLADRLRSLEGNYLLALQRHHGWGAGEPLRALVEAYAGSDTCLSRRSASGTVMLTPCAKQEGAWQVTWMTASGSPISDSIRATYGEALEVFWDSAIPQAELEFSLDGDLRFVAATDESAVFNEVRRQEECVL